LLLVPVGISATAAIIRGAAGPGICAALIGAGVAFCLFASLASGIVSSNQGTYLRRQEPVRFWTGVAILIVGYLCLCAAGWTQHPAKPPDPSQDGASESN